MKLVFLAKDAKKLKEKITKLSTTLHIDNEEFLDASMQLICSIDSRVFQELNTLLCSETRGQGQLELLSFRDVAEGDETLNDLHEEKTND
ncbi:unnamed protein product [Rotaria sordida]|uniref:Ribosome maturation protein SDO1/SBDS C-terminal domain-containing protein n=1 Tax=Rotaria sordida TaxID=392033 RepID=A0A815S8E4_9BILA|nr:unnamed protein product [Rotaria sordida]CAF1486789.1 unnamed protein product [Rotaria sordida]